MAATVTVEGVQAAAGVAVGVGEGGARVAVGTAAEAVGVGDGPATVAVGVKVAVGGTVVGVAVGCAAGAKTITS